MCKHATLKTPNIIRVKQSQGTYPYLVEVEGEWGSFGYGHTADEAAQAAFFNAVNGAKHWRKTAIVQPAWRETSRHVARVFLSQARLLRSHFQLRELGTIRGGN